MLEQAKKLDDLLVTALVAAPGEWGKSSELLNEWQAGMDQLMQSGTTALNQASQLELRVILERQHHKIRQLIQLAKDSKKELLDEHAQITQTKKAIYQYLDNSQTK